MSPVTSPTFPRTWPRATPPVRLWCGTVVPFPTAALLIGRIELLLDSHSPPGATLAGRKSQVQLLICASMRWVRVAVALGSLPSAPRPPHGRWARRRINSCDYGAEWGLSPVNGPCDHGAERRPRFRPAAKSYPVPSVLFVPSAPYRASQTLEVFVPLRRLAVRLQVTLPERLPVRHL